MATIVTRAAKGSPLTNTELDSNFSNLNTDKAELSGSTFTGNLSLGDNVKAQFGASNDLQIFHSGSHSFISEQGTGDLYIGASNNIALMNAAFSENKLLATTDGALKLYFNGSEKIATTATGIDVTGSVTADGLAVDGGDVTLSGTSSPKIRITDTTNTCILDLRANDSDVLIRATSNHPMFLNTNQKNRIQIAANGDISFYEDTGTTPKMVWDASTEELQIGGNLLNLSGVSSGTTGARISGNGNGTLRLASGGVDALTIVDGGNATFSGAVTATGTLTTGNITVNGAPTGSEGGEILLKGTSATEDIHIDSYDGTFRVFDQTTPQVRLSLDTSGNASFSGSVTSTGLTVTKTTLTDIASFINNNGSIVLGHYGGGSQIDLGSNIAFRIRQGSAIPLSINSSGNVNIPNGGLMVGSTTASNDALGLPNNNGISWINSNSYTHGIFKEGNSLNFRRTSGSGSVIGGDLSLSIDGASGNASFSGSVTVSKGGSTAAHGDTDFLVRHNSATSTTAQAQILAGNAGYSNLYFSDTDSYNVGGFIYNHASNYLATNVNGSEKMRIDSSGRVGIGTTQAGNMHTNASKLVVGTGSGDQGMSIFAGTSVGRYAFARSAANNSDAFDGGMSYDGNRNLKFHTNANATRMTIDGQGRVGIGTSSALFDVLTVDDSNPKISMRDSGTERAFFEVDSSDNFVINNKSTSAMILETSDTERMRITSSGDILINQSSTTSPGFGNTTTGLCFSDNGRVFSSASGLGSSFNRNSSDGTILDFGREGVLKGNISVSAYGMGFGGGTRSSDFFIKTDGTASFAETVSAPSVGKNKIGLQFVTYSDSVGAIKPYSITNTTTSDDKIDLGESNARFDDIYATNGTIQTSDQNEKQDIESLTEAEERVAVACKSLLKKFRWKSAVQEKGDDARIHFGIIAQDLQAAFEAEGLDAGRYGMFTSDTWTEDGVEKTRMGVRYNELLAFIISAI